MRGDDGIGPAVAARLGDRVPPGVAVTEHPGDGMDLMTLWAGAEAVVAVDAARSGSAPPGMVRRFDAAAAPLPALRLYRTSHAFGLAEAVETARGLGTLPPRFVVFAVEGADFSLGAGLSAAVAATVEALVERVLAELRRPPGQPAAP